jgi:hypothetical protein
MSLKIEFAIAKAKELGYIRDGDIVVVTAGHTQQAGGTDLICVVTVGSSSVRTTVSDTGLSGRVGAKFAMIPIPKFPDRPERCGCVAVWLPSSC